MPTWREREQISNSFCIVSLFFLRIFYTVYHFFCNFFPPDFLYWTFLCGLFILYFLCRFFILVPLSQKCANLKRKIFDSFSENGLVILLVSLFILRIIFTVYHFSKKNSTGLFYTDIFIWTFLYSYFVKNVPICRKIFVCLFSEKGRRTCWQECFSNYYLSRRGGPTLLQTAMSRDTSTRGPTTRTDKCNPPSLHRSRDTLPQLGHVTPYPPVTWRRVPSHVTPFPN